MAESTIASDMIDKTSYTVGVRSLHDTKAVRHFMVDGAASCKAAADYVGSIVTRWHPEDGLLPLQTISARWWGDKHLCTLRYGRGMKKGGGGVSVATVNIKGQLREVHWGARATDGNRPDLSQPTNEGGDADAFIGGGHKLNEPTTTTILTPVLIITVHADLAASAWADATVRSMVGKINDDSFNLGGFNVPKHTLMFHPPTQDTFLGGATPTFRVTYVFEYRWWGFYQSIPKTDGTLQVTKKRYLPETSFGAPPLS